MADLWAIDRWFHFAHFKRSASYSAEKMAEAGLDQVQVISFPADGRTAYGDWVAPLAWDVAGAELQVRSPQTLPLCSYQELPVSLAMWSAATPPGGIEAEVVLLDDWDDVAGPIEAQAPDPRLRGKILFGSRPGPETRSAWLHSTARSASSRNTMPPTALASPLGRMTRSVGSTRGATILSVGRSPAPTRLRSASPCRRARVAS